MEGRVRRQAERLPYNLEAERRRRPGLGTVDAAGWRHAVATGRGAAGDLMNNTALKHAKHGRDARATSGRGGSAFAKAMADEEDLETCVSAKRTRIGQAGIQLQSIEG